MSVYNLTQAVAMLDELTELGSSEEDQSDNEISLPNTEVTDVPSLSNVDDTDSTLPDVEPELAEENDSRVIEKLNPLTLIISNENPNDDGQCIIMTVRPSVNSGNVTNDNTDENNNKQLVIDGTQEENHTIATENESHINTADENNDKRGRKRIKDESTWKENVRKRLRQSGKEYTNVKGTLIREREMKNTKDCSNCKYRCCTMFSNSDREAIFKEFWGITDTEKNTFYANTTDRVTKQRQRTGQAISRRSCTMNYYLVKDLDRIRVCKGFYFATLDISPKRVEYFYMKASQREGFSDMRGSPRIPKISKQAKDGIRDHINSFPRVPSHYCRSSSTAEYLEPDLSVCQMYRLYIEKCGTDNIEPQTVNAYRNIFNTDFNLKFQKPKKDRCDLCEEYEMASKRIPILMTKHQNHILDKQLTFDERETDREMHSPNEVIVCFDMENVITCPRSNVSNFFYKRKLNVYNMTGHCSTDKMAYNIIWNEQIAGRGSNELASAVSVILEEVVRKHPDISKMTLWSDSCVPQNRNSIMAYALKTFQMNHPSVTEIVQKFCTPGHSSIQEIDNIHSHIEKKLKVSDIYSPLSVIRKLKQVRPDKMVIIQLKEDMIYDYQSAAAKFMYKHIPFTKVKSLRFVSGLPFHVYYKEAFDVDYTEIRITRQTRLSERADSFAHPKHFNNTPVLSFEKKKDIESMLRFMPQNDKRFMENLCHIGSKRPTVQ